MGSGGGLADVLAAASIAHQRIPLYDGTLNQRCSGCDRLKGTSDGPNSPRHVAHVADMQAAALAAHLEAVAGDAREAIAAAIDNQYEWRPGGEYGVEWAVNSHDAADAAVAAFIEAVTG